MFLFQQAMMRAKRMDVYIGESFENDIYLSQRFMTDIMEQITGFFVNLTVCNSQI